MNDSFDIRKKAVLGKIDKSSKGSWDERIIGFCDILNKDENYYTTSSCSGKCILMEDKVGRDGSYYLWVTHDLLDDLDLNNFLYKKGLIKFKCEGPSIFVVCRDLEHAKGLLWNARDSGFKKSGINVTEKLIGVEIGSGERLEFPIIKDGKVLVSDEFLKEVIKKSNFNLKNGWEKIEKLKGLV